MKTSSGKLLVEVGLLEELGRCFRSQNERLRQSSESPECGRKETEYSMPLCEEHLEVV